MSLAVEGDELEALVAVLSADERVRADRFVRPSDASRSAAARGHLRQLLGCYLECPATEVALGTGPYGKPYVSAPGAGWLRFNVSHSGDLALIAVANGREVGVDVERIQPGLATPSLAALFTPAEQRVLAGLARDEYIRQCFRMWTRKEAVLKGLGVGLGVPLDGVDVLDDQLQLGPDIAGHVPHTTTVWAVLSLPMGASYSAACALAGRDVQSPTVRHVGCRPSRDDADLWAEHLQAEGGTQ